MHGRCSMASDILGSIWIGARHGRISANGTRLASATQERTNYLQQTKKEVAEVLLKDKMNVLLLLLPLAIASKAAGWPAGATFILALLPLCSLAERLGMITEQLAMYTNDTLGGLLNATFGNATEVIITAFAIQKGLLRVVKLTLLGSIIGNLLLVMGSAFVAGGLIHPMQTFSQQGIIVNVGLLILSVVAIMLPTLLSSTAESVKDFGAELALSRFESVLMLLCYGMFLVFQLITHRHLYEEESSKPDMSLHMGFSTANTSCCEDPSTPDKCTEMTQLPSGSSRDNLVSTLGGKLQGTNTTAGSSQQQQPGSSNTLHSNTTRRTGTAAGLAGDSNASGYATVSGLDQEAGHGQIGLEADTVRLVIGEASVQFIEEDEEKLVLSKAGCFIWLAIVTLLISVLSDLIMEAITEASKQLKVPMPFLTTIVVPIVGNAAEHASALIFAIKNRMEISLGVAVGSSTQIGVLVVPFCVLLAWCMGQPLDLNFNEFEALVLFISVLLAALMVQDGSSNWLKGAMLILTYVFAAAGFWVHKDPLLISEDGEGN